MNTENNILYIGSHQNDFKAQVRQSGFSEDSFSIDAAEDTTTLDKLLEKPYSAIVFDVIPGEKPSIVDLCCRLDGVKTPEIHGGHRLGIFLNEQAEYDRDLVECVQAESSFPIDFFSYSRGIETLDGIKQTGVNYNLLIGLLKGHFNEEFASLNSQKYHFLLNEGRKTSIDLNEILRAAKDIGSTDKAIALMIAQVGGKGARLVSASIEWKDRVPHPTYDPLSKIQIAIDGPRGGLYCLEIPEETKQGFTTVSSFKRYEQILSRIYHLAGSSCASAADLTGYSERLARYGFSI